MRIKTLALSICAMLANLLQAGAQELEVTDLTAPVMLQREFNPVMGLRITTSNDDQLLQVAVDVEENRFKEIEEIAVYHTLMDKNGEPHGDAKPDSEKLGTVDVTRAGKGRYIIKCDDVDLYSGDNYFLLAVTLSEKASVERTVKLSVAGVKTKEGVVQSDLETEKKRIGVAITFPNFPVEIREARTGKVIEERTSKYARIPGIITTRKGTIIATFDNRYAHNGDLPADIDVAISRSTDGGQTWSPVSTCMNARDIPGIGRGVGDPAILLDPRKNRVWIAGLAAPQTGHPIWKSETGSADPAVCGQFILVYSDDEGQTWSEPINITEDIKRLDDSDTESWGLVFQGPGNGICMRDGTLVFPAQIWGEKEPGGKMGDLRMGVLVYSKDRGKTWQSSKAMEFGGSESTVVELSDGSLMMNTREGHGGWRQVGVTKDLGQTWKKHSSVNKEKGRLRNPFCQANTLALFNPVIKPYYQFGESLKHVLIHTSPNAGRRSHMTLKTSRDDGKTWNEGLLYDERWCMGYSAIIPVDRKHLGVFYESQHHYLHFLKIPFEEILSAP